MIKAIETAWNGWRFRSRLEARWAVFMDRAGVVFEYEPEGFETEAGKYLPDFYLPEHRIWLDIKPRIELVSEYDRKRIIALGEAKQDERVLVIDGEPWLAKYEVHGVLFGELRFMASPWLQCPLCGRIGPNSIACIDEKGNTCASSDLRVSFCVPCANQLPATFGWVQSTGVIHSSGGNSFVPVGFDLEGCKTRLAFLAARRARFEHGARP